MKLSPEEKEIIEKYRKEQDYSKPFAEGFVKDNLYSVNEIKFKYNHIFTELEKEKCIVDFQNSFKLLVPMNGKFICYKNEDGSEEWYSDNGNIEGIGSDWAKENLKDIKTLKKIKK